MGILLSTCARFLTRLLAVALVACCAWSGPQLIIVPVKEKKNEVHFLKGADKPVLAYSFEVPHVIRQSVWLFEDRAYCISCPSRTGTFRFRFGTTTIERKQRKLPAPSDDLDYLRVLLDLEVTTWMRDKLMSGDDNQVVLYVHGFTDPRECESEEEAVGLSLSRARRVGQLLVERGIPEREIRLIAHGWAGAGRIGIGGTGKDHNGRVLISKHETGVHLRQVLQATGFEKNILDELTRQLPVKAIAPFKEWEKKCVKLPDLNVTMAVPSEIEIDTITDRHKFPMYCVEQWAVNLHQYFQEALKAGCVFPAAR